jgi:site-specific DNA-methyltransferase (adenine-specific)
MSAQPTIDPFEGCDEPSVDLGDGLAGLAGLEPGSASLVLCDLPSGDTVATFDKPVDLPDLFRAAWRALDPRGNVVLMASSIRFASEVIAAGGDAYRYDLVWSKSAATGFLNARSRPLRSHEFILVFNRGAASRYAPQMTTGHAPISSNFREGSRRRGRNSENYDVGPRTSGRDAGRARTGATDRFPRSVLEFGSVGTRDPIRTHPQQKPEDLLRCLVRTYTDPGDLVVDPCAGSGSAGKAAIVEGRRFRGWDIDPRFGQ